MRYLLTVTLCLVTILSVMGQNGMSQSGNGIIRGTVYDDVTGETLIGVTVFLKGTTIGSITDLDGQFTIEVQEGTYDLQVSYVSYETITVESLQVKNGEVVLFDNLRMSNSSQQLETVIVAAEATRRTENALMDMKKKSIGMIDGISSAKFQLTGDATAGEAAKRVTGVTIEGGKYIYVRGLGDRYSKTTLNDMDVPGLDPDRNSIQLDIFPSNLIDNLVVRKNFTADMSAEFTGGIMNIETKSFPEERFTSFSFGTSYNPQMHFNPNFLTYDGGSTDFLGFDDGTRALPARANSPFIPTPISGASTEEVNNFVRSFSPTLAAREQTSLVDYSASFTTGNQIELKRRRGNTEGITVHPKLGYVLAASYRTDYEHYDDVIYGEYQRYIDPERTEMRYATVQNGVQSIRNTLLGGLAGLAYKTQTSKIRLTIMRLQNGISTAGQFRIDNDGEAVGQSGYFAASDNLEYNQRSLTNILLNGKHVFANKGWDIDWRISPTLSTSVDPDIRKTAFTFTPIDTFFSAGAGGNPARIWRYLDEVNLAARVDFNKSYQLFGSDAKLQFGASHTYKQRDYEILFFDIQFFANQNWDNPDPAVVLDPANIFPNRPNSIYYQSGNNFPNPNAYNSNANNTGVYVSNEFTPLPNLKTILGLRAENFVLRHTGRDQRYASGDVINGRNLVNEKVLSSLDLFPSAIFIYALNSRQNVRASYSRTIARPTFKELSFAQILDPISNRIFNGSLFTFADWDGQLTETLIDNIDLRWELFMEGGQLVSVSAFYKQFDNPIELVRIPEQQTSTEFQPRNVGNGSLVGVELEVRKNLEFLNPRLRPLSFDVNITLVDSRIDMTALEFNARRQYEKVGQTVSNTRAMAGQSPYVINAGFTYSQFEKGITAGLYYNVKGETLHIVGTGLYPDIYTQPFHSLNFGFNKKFGEDQRTVLDVKASNILDDKREIFYRSFEADPQPFDVFNPGRAFSIGISHKF